ncbi:restriction endonuclease subunit S [Shewanella xiamenensis]|uniref:restriction endonuclease subunit S n=1 Tax=Shewanella xiamenensis TaxID=332186 RepID=UPI003F1CDA2D
MAVWSEVLKSVVTHEHRLDAEFFDPKYLKINDLLVNLSCKDMLGKLANNVKKGIFDISPSRYKSKGVPLIRTFQIKTPIANEDNLVYINDIDHQNEFKKTELLPGDIVFTKIGAGIGDVAVLPETFSKFNFSQNVAGVSVKSESISSYYLISFLNSFYGRTQILRYMMPSGQGKLELRDIKKIIIPRFDASLETEVSKLMKSSEEKALLSKSLYTQAQELLEKELGLDKLVLDRPKSYETSFSEVISGGRIDSDYFQVHFKQQANHLSMIQSKPLRELVDFQKGIEVGSPAYTSSGKLFVRVSNVKKTGVVTGNSDKYISETLFNSLVSYQPKIGDILLTKDGTVGVCYVVDEPVDGIISGGIMKLSKKDESIPSEYLALVINSPICQFQIDRDCSGALIVHWKPKDIAALKIPILTEDKMAELSDLVNQSKIAKKESEQLLDQAKRMVEELIEGAI